MSDSYLDTVGDVAIVVGDVLSDSLDTGADLLDEIGPDLVDLADAAAVTAVASGRIGFRLLSRLLRLIGRHPKKALIALVLIAAAGAVASVVCSNSDRNSNAE
jgi:hypothetical protein